jgi:hypothetical protein
MSEVNNSITQGESFLRSREISRRDDPKTNGRTIRRGLRVAVLAVLVSAFSTVLSTPASAAAKSVSIEVLPTQSVEPRGTAKYPFVVRSKGAVVR